MSGASLFVLRISSRPSELEPVAELLAGDASHQYEVTRRSHWTPADEEVPPVDIILMDDQPDRDGM